MAHGGRQRCGEFREGVATRRLDELDLHRKQEAFRLRADPIATAREELRMKNGRESDLLCTEIGMGRRGGGEHGIDVPLSYLIGYVLLGLQP